MRLRAWWKPRSLSTRVTLLLGVITLVVLGAGSKWMDWRIDHAMQARFQQNVLYQALALRAMVQAGGSARAHAPLPTYAGSIHRGDATFYEVDCAGRAPERSAPALPTLPDGWPDSATDTPRFTTRHHHRAHLVFVQFRFDAATAGAAANAATPCRLVFAQDRSAMDELLGEIDWILLLSPALALLLALVAVPLVVRRGMHPVAALVAQMRHIGPDVPGQRLAASGVRELDPLIARFNDVLARMDAGLAREREFAAGLAHETRTRLAELRALTEVESRYPTGRSVRDLLAEVGSIGRELEATVTALLLLTRLQAGIEQPQPQTIALAPWLDHQLERVQAAADARQLTLRTRLRAGVSLRADPALLDVVVGNLLANACAYAPVGDTVTVALGPDRLVVTNAAPGLAPEDLASLGSRFWRKERSQAAHAGLGLALATAAARVLGCSLAFELDAAARLHAVLTWPDDARAA